MHGADVRQGGLFSCVPVENRIPANHPSRAVRTLLDEALATMSHDFDRVCAKGGRSSVPPERRVRALVLQVLYSIRSERLLMEQLDYIHSGHTSRFVAESAFRSMNSRRGST
jgi:transposase